MLRTRACSRIIAAHSELENRYATQSARLELSPMSDLSPQRAPNGYQPISAHQSRFMSTRPNIFPVCIPLLFLAPKNIALHCERCALGGCAFTPNGWSRPTDLGG